MTIDQEPIDSPQGWVADHVKRYIETNGEDGHLWRGAPTLILTTLGRRSGKPRRLALIYGTDGDRYIVVASKGGAAKHPEWYLNLRDNPEVAQAIENKVRENAGILATVLDGSKEEETEEE